MTRKKFKVGDIVYASSDDYRVCKWKIVAALSWDAFVLKRRTSWYNDYFRGYIDISVKVPEEISKTKEGCVI